MGNWKLIVPQATVNLVSNPSIEKGDTGYTDVGAGVSAARSSVAAYFGVYSLAVAPNNAVGDGVYTTVVLENSVTYTFSLYLKDTAAKTYKIYFASNATGAALATTTYVGTGSGAWVRLSVTYASVAAATRRLYVTVDSSVTPFYVDGWQCEAAAAATTYCDGDQDGCYWLGAPHASQSVRPAVSRLGGLPTALSDYSLYLTQYLGAGMAPVTVNRQPMALQAGSTYLNTHTGERAFYLVADTLFSDSQANFHALRAALIGALAPNGRPKQQPCVLRYSGAAVEKETRAYYVEGLGLGQVTGPQTEPNVAVGFVATDPNFYAVPETGAVLTARTSVVGADYLIYRDADGTWAGVPGFTPNASVQLLKWGPDGKLYIGGLFNNAKLQYLVAYDPAAGTVDRVGTVLNGGVYDVVWDAAGLLYAVGAFTNAGGVANADYIATWDGVAWAAVGNPNSGGAAMTLVRRAVFDHDGNLIIGGNFTDLAGVAAADYVALWDGATWAAMGSGLDNLVYCLAVGLDNTIYAGGTFTDYIVAYDGATWTALGGGADAAVQAIAVHPNGAVFVGGSFQDIGGVTCNRVAMWNGVQYSSLADGIDNGYVSSIGFDGSGYVWLGGSFTLISDMTRDGVVVWNGSTYVPAAINVPGSTAVITLAVLRGEVAISYNNVGDMTAAGVTTVNNSGNQDAFPVVEFDGPGVLYALFNYTTGEAIFFNNLTLSTGETATLDLRPTFLDVAQHSPYRGKSFVSSWRGNLFHTIAQGSNLSGWHLAPGNNYVGVFIDNAAAAARLRFHAPYWSLD